jgi:hypothetical protein
MTSPAKIMADNSERSQIRSLSFAQILDFLFFFREADSKETVAISKIAEAEWLD